MDLKSLLNLQLIDPHNKRYTPMDRDKIIQIPSEVRTLKEMAKISITGGKINSIAELDDGKKDHPLTIECKALHLTEEIDLIRDTGGTKHYPVILKTMDHQPMEGPHPELHMITAKTM